ncbi:uncharacterized protein JN550_003099 [Neoarthrinium moseri]|uniref:uncharacterized protein n=1 Tax=Neoarthrinium moseri TaxID=1658444 RepID=UPI001FDDAD0B|nr:uncharacterized protein JN550_003099 [Neoarthrinium moseri]KAI1873830.1 hypothetical protein JN550_003099 [Neoarthrinium moseri]
MHFNSSYPSNDFALRQAILQGKSGNTMATKKPRQLVSQPVHAEDLRRRLYVVISEQNSAREKRRRDRAEAMAYRKRTAEQPHQEEDITNKDEASAKVERIANEPGVGVRTSTIIKSDSIIVPESTDDWNTEKEAQLDFGDAIKRIDTGRELRSKIVSRSQIPKEPYHHVPSEAATQFARTATAKGLKDKSSIHDLSHQAMKAHREGHLTDAGKMPADHNRELRKVRSYQEKLFKRNQFQNTRALEESVGGNAPRSAKQRHTIPNGYSDLPATRRFSGLRESLDERATNTHEAIPENAVVDLTTVNLYRADWTQSDEIQDRRKGMKSPLLRKADSLWGLKERFTKHGREAREGHHGSEKIQAIALKSPKSGIFGRFKRQLATVVA